MAAYMDARFNNESDESGDDEVDYGLDDEDDEELVATCAPSQCVFCDLFHETGELTLKHVEDEHLVPLSKLFSSDSFDFYSYIKLINYLRKQKPDAGDLQSLESLRKLNPLNESYMIPVDADDGLLQFDFDTYQEKLRRVAPTQTLPDSKVTISLKEHCMLTSQTVEIQRLRAELESLKHRYSTDVKELRASAQRLINSAPVITSNGDSSGPQQTTNNKNTSKVHRLTEAEDDGYIGSYTHYSIHLEMLQDTVRTASYRDAICSNADMFKDKVVLDVGCGTGILSMFAARAGASHVFGVDMSDIAYQAMDIVRENGLSDKVSIVKGRIEEIILPVDKVDIIISEWMGYFLLFESMLDSVIFARRKWMNTGGTVWPNVCRIFLTASCDSTLRTRNISFWDDVYGFKMSCMKGEVCRDALVQVVDAGHIVSAPTCVKTVDCCTCDVADLDFTTEFTLCVERDCSVYALIGYFDTVFESDAASTRVEFSTGPDTKSTHWKQTVFLLPEPVEKLKEEEISGSIDVRKLANDPRSLQVEITIGAAKHKYILS